MIQTISSQVLEEQSKCDDADHRLGMIAHSFLECDPEVKDPSWPWMENFGGHLVGADFLAS